MIVFDKPGKQNTDDALKIALDYASKHNLDIVLATTDGQSVDKLLEIKGNYKGNIVAITHVYGMKEKGKNEISKEKLGVLKEKGVKIVTAAHALSAGERGLSTHFKGVYPLEIVAATLRMFSQGVKVCVEVSIMALDAGKIEYGKPVVCIGGTGKGQDTVCIVTPDYSADLLNTKVNEILCKPGFY